MSAFCAATSTASLIAIPSDPVESGSWARIFAAALGQVRRARVDGRAEGLHHHPAVRLLVVRRPHLPDLALQPELRAGERQRGAPLARPGLGGELPDPGLRVVERLRHGGVRLVRPGRRDALVLVVDPGRRAERLLQPVRPVQRRRPPQPVDVEHLRRDVDVPVLRHLLQDQIHREQRGQVVRADRLAGARMQHRRRWRRQVVQHVVPAGRELVLRQQDLRRGAGGSHARNVRPDLLMRPAVRVPARGRAPGTVPAAGPRPSPGRPRPARWRRRSSSPRCARPRPC